MPEQLTIYCTQTFTGEALSSLREATAHHRLLIADKPNSHNLQAGGADPRLAEADVAFGQPDVATVMASQRLKWVHLTTAGYERYAGEDFRRALRSRKAILTNSSSVYCEPVAQHAVAMMLALARNLPQAWDAQRTDHAWPYRQLRAQSRLLTQQTALLLGFGAIGKRLVKLLTPFGMNLIAVRTRVLGDEPCRTCAAADLEQVLPLADHVVSSLPGGTTTRNYMNESRFAAMKPGAVFYNVGRGTTVDQDALLAALRSGRLGAAYLDVTEPEPLPPDHPLWTAPNCHITPHSAGGHVDEPLRIVRHFLANLKRFDQGEALLDRIV